MKRWVTLTVMALACLAALASGPGASAQAARRVDYRVGAVPGCGVKPGVRLGVSATQTMDIGGVARSYLLRLPPSYRRNTPTPLVLAFHGHGGASAPFEGITRFSRLADRYHFIVVYPQGTVGPDGQTGWNTSRGEDPTVDDVGFVDALLTR